jgi:capsular exopolysaccharide synthesis family protein
MRSMPDFADLLRVAWRRKTALALGMLLGLALGTLYELQCPPVYRSEAQVLVTKKRPEAVTADGRNMSPIEDYATTHRILMQSPVIIERAIPLGKLDSLESFAGIQGDLTEAIGKKLTVTNVSKDTGGTANCVLQLSFRGTVADECSTVVNAVLDSYQSFLAETYQDRGRDIVELVKNASDVLENKLAEKETAYRQLRAKSPLVLKGKEEVDPHQDRLTMIESKRAALLLRQAEIEGQLRTIGEARKAGLSEDRLVALVSDLAVKASGGEADRNAAATVNTQLVPLLLEEQSLLQDFGPNHPLVLSVRERIGALREFSAAPATANKSRADGTGSGRGTRSGDLVTRYVERLDQELRSIQDHEQALAKMFEQERQDAQTLHSYEIEEAQLRNGIARTQTLYDGVVKQLQDVSLVKEYGGFDARVIAPAGTGKHVAPNALLVFTAAGFLGMLAGFGLAGLAEVTDRRFRTLADVRRGLGLPILGQLPRLAHKRRRAVRAASSGPDAMLFAQHRPRSTGAEACRAIAGALDSLCTGREHAVIQITSPGAGEGTSTVAANLAVCYAQSGQRTLLIDADFRRPRQHQLFGLSAPSGLAAVLTESSEVAEAIQDSGVPNLWILPAGRRPTAARDLLASPRFRELLDLVREQYDHVLVDTSSMSELPDPSSVASCVDGVLLTVRIPQRGRSRAKRARELLDSLDANVFGVVVNAVEAGEAGGFEPATADSRFAPAERPSASLTLSNPHVS